MGVGLLGEAGPIGGGGLLGPIGTIATGIYDIIAGGPGYSSPTAGLPPSQTILGPGGAGIVSNPPAATQPRPPTPGTPGPTPTTGPSRIPIPGTGLSIPAEQLGQVLALILQFLRPRPATPTARPPTITINAPRPVRLPAPTPASGGSGGDMPYIPTSPLQLDAGSSGGWINGGSGTDVWGQLIQGGAQVLSSIFGGNGGNGGGGMAVTLPGGATVPGTGGGIPGVDLAPEGSSGFLGAFVSSPYRVGGTSSPRAQDFAMRNPVSGRLQYWRYAGRPLIYSGDRGICRRVKKTARRLGGV